MCAHLFWFCTGVIAEINGCHARCMRHGHGGARRPRICSVRYLWALPCNSTPHTHALHQQLLHADTCSQMRLMLTARASCLRRM